MVDFTQDANFRLALVHDWLTGMRGGEKCLEPLCRRFPQAHLHTLLHVPGSTTKTIEGRLVKTSFLQNVPGVGRHYRYLLPLMPLAAESLKIDVHADLILSFSHAVAKCIHPPRQVPHVCYCFTPMRYAWQMRGQYFDADASPSGTIIARRLRGGLAAARNAVLDRIQEWDRRTSDRVTHFIACSHTIRDRIQACYGRSSEVIYPPVDTDFYTPAPVPREDFYLCVSALAPYKRIELAMRACQKSGRRLIVIGSGPEHKNLLRFTDHNVRLLGWQTDAIIRDYFRRCRAVLFPGEEDFGIVPVEAQACGAAVIAFGCGGATETVLEATASTPGTGLHFAHQTVDSLCDAITRFEQQPEVYCPRFARNHAEQFCTQRYEVEMLAFLRRVHQGETHSTQSLATTC